VTVLCSKVFSSGAWRFHLDVEGTDTILEVKDKIADQEHLPQTNAHLSHQNVELDNGLTLSEYNIQEGGTLEMVLSKRWIPDCKPAAIERPRKRIKNVKNPTEAPPLDSDSPSD